MTDYTLTGSTAEMRAKAAQERANLLARNVREFREAEAKAKAVHIEHADHAMQCGDCDNLYKRIARLERKAKKWKRRAKKAEALTYSKANLDAGFAERAKELACGCLVCVAHTAKVATLDGSWTQQSQAEQAKADRARALEAEVAMNARADGMR